MLRIEGPLHSDCLEMNLCLPLPARLKMKFLHRFCLTFSKSKSQLKLASCLEQI